MPRLHVIDGSGYIFRAYWAIRSLTNSAGEATNAVYGFANMLEKLLREESPEHLCLVFDASGPTFRNQLYAPYKATRPPPPEDLEAQIPRIHQLVDAFGIPALTVDGVEADDVIATLVRIGVKAGYDVRLISGDKDLMQLVGPQVALVEPMKGETYDAAGVEAKLGVPPERVADALALAGDSTDNVPGVKGVGLKTAAKLLHAHGSLEEVLSAARAGDVKGKVGRTLAESVEDARLSRQLVTLKDDVDIGLELDDLRYEGPDPERLVPFYTELEFTRLLERWESSEEAEPTVGSREAAFALDAEVPVAASVDDLKPVLQAARSTGWIAIELETTEGSVVDAERVGLGLAAGDVTAYVPFAHQGVAAVEVRPVYDALRSLLADGVQWTSSAAKRVVGTWMEPPAPEPGFESSLVSYLLDPDEGDHGPEAVGRRHFGVEPEPRAPALRKDRKRRPFSAVEPERAARIVGQAAQVGLAAQERLPELLEREGLTGLFEDVELPLVSVLSRMERTGVRLDTDRLAEMAEVFAAELDRLERACHAAAGREFNVGSTKQLEQILFEELELKIVKRTATGRPSTDHSVLEALADSHELPGAVLEHRQIQKLKNTYVDALPKLISPRTNRVHTTFNQTMAATGRLSSAEPNLQNIPIRSELGRQLRTVFVAEPGYRLVSVDYSQVELRVLGHFTEEKVLVEAFAERADVHTRTAAVLFDVEPQGVTREMRTQAKAVNFGVLYGMGPVRLARDLKIPRRQASSFVKDYFDRQPAVKAFIDQTLEDARATGEVRTLLGRRRRVSDLGSRNRAARAAAERIATNTPIQGSAADLIKLAMLRVDAVLRDRFPTARLVLQVHDELLVEAEADEAEAVAEMVKEQMESAFPLRVPLEAQAHIGETWDEAH
jgi:DNA polymerase-1